MTASRTRPSSATTCCRSSASTTLSSASSRPSCSPPRARNRPAVRIFLGITGASGAPYAARLVEALAGADVELGICSSSAGIEVVATELYGNPRLSRDETLTRLLEHARGGNVTVYEPNDWKAPYASGSAKVDAYVICPCSMGTLGTIASGAMSNLIHRAASVALKEGRRLVLVPRETPLSTIHLENMLTLRQARAVVLFAAPGFYPRAACCGTGDLALAAHEAGGRVTGLDFSEPMLARARRKSQEVEWVRGDLLELPFEDDSFDAATVGFGVRNVADLGRALAELRRALRQGGRLGILEITTPRGPLRHFYRLWFDGLVPLLGKALPGGSAYTYLPASVRRFPDAESLAALLDDAAFTAIRYRFLAGGIVALHTAEAA